MKTQEEKKNSLQACAFKKKTRLNSALLAAAAPSSPNRACVRVLRLSSSCSARSCVRVWTQLERLLPHSSVGYIERSEQEEVWRLHQPAVWREEEEEGLQRLGDWRWGRGAGLGDLNGRYAQPIMGVGMHLGFWIPSRKEMLFTVLTSAAEGEFSVNSKKCWSTFTKTAQGEHEGD